jgi:hypothetical protein
MKKLLLIPAIIAVVGSVAFVQAQDKTPEAVKSAFKKAYPGATKVKYEKEGKDYEVAFVLGGKEMSAVYNANGGLLETEEPVGAGQLPAAVMPYYNAHYKGIAIKETTKIVNNKGVVTYELGTKKKDVIFNADGKFVKEVAIGKEEDEKD